MTTTITRLPDPSGPVNSPAGEAITLSLDFEPAGRYLAHVHQLPIATDPMRLVWYRRDGDQLVKLADPEQLDPVTQGVPIGCWWHPSGEWLIVSSTNAHMTFDDPRLGRLFIYRRSGDTLTLLGAGPDAITGPYQQRISLAFDATGRWLAIAENFGFVGLAAFDPATGALSVASGGHYTGSDDQLGLGFAWHPTDSTLLAKLDGYAAVQMWRRTGGTLTRLTGSGVDAAVFANTIAWHPDGELLLVGALSGVPGGAPGRGNGLLGLAWPGLTRSWIADRTATGFVDSASFQLDPSGRYLAAGPIYLIDENGCGFSTLLGLLVDELTVTGSQVSAAAMIGGGYDPSVSGAHLAWAPGAGASSYLAVSVSDWDAAPVRATDRWGVGLLRVDGAPSSILSQVRGTGGYTVVGTTARPLMMRLPGGGWRRWPDTGAPLYEKQTDGTWKKVIG